MNDRSELHSNGAKGANRIFKILSTLLFLAFGGLLGILLYANYQIDQSIMVMQRANAQVTTIIASENAVLTSNLKVLKQLNPGEIFTFFGGMDVRPVCLIFLGYAQDPASQYITVTVRSRFLGKNGEDTFLLDGGAGQRLLVGCPSSNGTRF